MPSPRSLLSFLLLFTVVSSGCSELDEPELGTSEAELLALGPAGTRMSVLVARRTGWSYNDQGVDLGTAWRTGSVSWPSGQAPLGYGESYVNTTVSFGGNPSAKHITTYFRRSFHLPSTPVRKLYLRVMYDDGFVFYFNGKEGGRAYMPSGPVEFSTLSTGHETGNQYVTYDITAQLPNLSTSALNTIAFEVHQVSGSSSDLVFDAELIAWSDQFSNPGITQELPRGSHWYFWDRGGDLGTAWRQPGFDHSAWSHAPGPLGFGENYVVADVAPGPITHYFRADFLVEGSVSGLIGEVMYDDGFVVYLNGQEIARAAMPGGTVTASTLAFGHEANEVYQRFDWSAWRHLLVPGENTIAVEVHQSSASSSDLVFDLSLDIPGAWGQQASGTSADLLAVAALDASRAWAVGEGGTIVRTTDGGATWSAQPSGGGATLRAIEFVDATHGHIVGDGGTILATSDAGATWQARSAGVTADFRDVWFLDASTGWVLAADAIYRTGDGGATWTAVATPAGDFYGVRFSDAMNGIIAGSRPVPGDSWASIFRTTDGGATWTLQWESGVHHYYLWGLEAIDASTAWAFGQGSLSGVGENKLVTHDGGVTWTEAPETDNVAAMYDLDFLDADASLGWGVGFHGSIIRTEDGGATWEVSQPTTGEGVQLEGVAFADADHGWAVGLGGLILRTTTGGASQWPRRRARPGVRAR